MSRSYRGPLIAVGVGVALLLIAMLLDRGGERSRDLALLIGAPTLYVILPLAVLWLVTVAVLRRLRGPGSGRG